MEIPKEPKYTGLPRRYEETKPALEQVYTHGSIISVGSEILENFKADLDKQKDDALKECEKRLWQEAETYKNKSVQDALQRASDEESLRVADLENQHEMHLHDEIQRVTEVLRQQCVEERFEECKNGEARMRQMSEQMQRHHALDKMAEIKAARIEEQAIAENTAQEMMRRHEAAMQMFGEEMEEAKNAELSALQFKMEDICNDSVRQAREEERYACNEKLQELQHSHDTEKSTMHATVVELTQEKQQLESDLQSMTNQRDDYIDKYEKLRCEFTEFIERCRPDFSLGQADFLLPPK